MGTNRIDKRKDWDQNFIHMEIEGAKMEAVEVGMCPE